MAVKKAVEKTTDTTKPLKIPVSFKNNTKERELYNYFKNIEDTSGEIKKILRDWYEKNVKQELKVNKNEAPVKTPEAPKQAEDYFNF